MIAALEVSDGVTMDHLPFLDEKKRWEYMGRILGELRDGQADISGRLRSLEALQAQLTEVKTDLKAVQLEWFRLSGTVTGHSSMLPSFVARMDEMGGRLDDVEKGVEQLPVIDVRLESIEGTLAELNTKATNARSFVDQVRGGWIVVGALVGTAAQIILSLITQALTKP